jgi:hypothetical protein
MPNQGGISAAPTDSTVLSAADLLRNHPRIVFLFIGGGYQLDGLADRCKAFNLCHINRKSCCPAHSARWSRGSKRSPAVRSQQSAAPLGAPATPPPLVADPSRAQDAIGFKPVSISLQLWPPLEILLHIGCISRGLFGHDPIGRIICVSYSEGLAAKHAPAVHPKGPFG